MQSGPSVHFPPKVSSSATSTSKPWQMQSNCALLKTSLEVYLLSAVPCATVSSFFTHPTSECDSNKRPHTSVLMQMKSVHTTHGVEATHTTIIKLMSPEVLVRTWFGQIKDFVSRSISYFPSYDAFVFDIEDFWKAFSMGMEDLSCI